MLCVSRINRSGLTGICKLQATLSEHQHQIGGVSAKPSAFLPAWLPSRCPAPTRSIPGGLEHLHRAQWLRRGQWRRSAQRGAVRSAPPSTVCSSTATATCALRPSSTWCTSATASPRARRALQRCCSGGERRARRSVQSSALRTARSRLGAASLHSHSHVAPGRRPPLSQLPLRQCVRAPRPRRRRRRGRHYNDLRRRQRRPPLYRQPLWPVSATCVLLYHFPLLLLPSCTQRLQSWMPLATASTHHTYTPIAHNRHYPGLPKARGLDTAAQRLAYFRQGLDALARTPGAQSFAFPFLIGCGGAGAYICLRVLAVQAIARDSTCCSTLSETRLLAARFFISNFLKGRRATCQCRDPRPSPYAQVAAGQTTGPSSSALLRASRRRASCCIT